MRKLISVLLAVASIVCTTSSLAASSTGVLAPGSEPRNDKTAMETVSTNADNMPAFRGGDTVKFDVSSLTSGKVLTVISYKYNSADLSNSTIQCIEQYDIDQDTQSVEYKVRENADDGIYKLSFSGNETDEGSEIKDFYYKVGNPIVTMMLNGNKNYWNIKSYEAGNGQTLYAVGYVAKAVIGSSDVSLTDVGIVGLGIKLTANGKTITRELDQAHFEAISNAKKYESKGSLAFVYGVTVYGIDSVASADDIDAETVKKDN